MRKVGREKEKRVLRKYFSKNANKAISLWKSQNLELL